MDTEKQPSKEALKEIFKLISKDCNEWEDTVAVYGLFRLLLTNTEEEVRETLRQFPDEGKLSDDVETRLTIAKKMIKHYGKG